MGKQFRLPKTFANKWLEALRSGEYNQTDGVLLAFEEYDESPKYCCLGVGGTLCNVPKEYLSGHEFLNSTNFIENGLPSELVGENDFTHLLSSLNDGATIHAKWNNACTFRPEVVSKIDSEKFTFIEIADFIEDNCEFY